VIDVLGTADLRLRFFRWRQTKKRTKAKTRMPPNAEPTATPAMAPVDIESDFEPESEAGPAAGEADAALDSGSPEEPKAGLAVGGDTSVLEPGRAGESSQ